jgi:putative addiction module component (TIGR02574 family)
MSRSTIEIDKLSPEDRLQLIEELWESLRRQPEAVPLTEAQRKELDRRLDEIDRGEAETIPWDEVKQRLRGGSE